MRSLGAGIEKIESDVARFFPAARVAKFDRDSTAVAADANVIVATQAVTRVLDEIKPDIIGVLDFDSQFNRADFRSGEQAFALLWRFRQAAGDKVVVQTNEPHNYCLRALVKNDIDGFYKKELALRKELGFPPFTHLVSVTARGIKQEDVAAHARELQEKIQAGLLKGVEIFEVQPDYVPKLRDKYRFTIMLKGHNVVKLLQWLKPLLKSVKRGKVIVTVRVEE